MRRPLQVAAMVVAYTVLFTWFSVRRHDCFAVGDWDVGIFDQSFWTAAKLGMPFFNTYEGHSHFAYHNSPVFILLLPFYWLWPHPETLFALQSLALALGAVPVYLLGRDLVGERTGLLFAALYLLYFPLHGINYHDFHETAFGVAPMLLALWGMRTGHRRWMWTGALLAMLSREDMGILLIGMALLALYRERGAAAPFRLAFRTVRPSASPADPAPDLPPGSLLRHPTLARGDILALLGVGVLWTWLSSGVIMPYFLGPGHPAPIHAARFAHLGRTPLDWVLSPVLQPATFWGHLFSGVSLSYVMGLLAPLAFLSLLELPVLLVAAPVLVMNLESGFGGMHLFTSHYAGPLIPFVFAAGIEGCSRLVFRGGPVPEPAGSSPEEGSPVGAATRRLPLQEPREASRADARGLRLCRPAVVLALLTMLAFDPSPLHLGRAVPSIDDHARTLQVVVASVPPGASVSAPVHVWTHLTDRRDAFPFYREGVDFIIADESNDRMKVFMHEGGFDRSLPPLLASGTYVLDRRIDGISVYRRTPRVTPSELLPWLPR